MGLMLQVTWQLMNLCIIIAAIEFPRSSVFGEPLSLDSSSPFPSIEAKVPTSIVEQGPFINGSIDQPPIISPSINTPPFHELIEGPPPFPSPTQSTTLPPQQSHVLAPQFPAQPPKASFFPSTKPPQHSDPPIPKLPHEDPPPLPLSEPPHHSALPSEPPRGLDVPPVAIPQPPTAQPPETLPLASPPLPVEVPQPTSAIPSPPTPSVWAPLFPLRANASSRVSPQPSMAKPPLSSALPLAANPPELPIAAPPTTTPRPSDMHSPPLSQNAPSSPHLVLPNVPPPMSIVIPHGSPPLPLPSPFPPPNVVSPPPFAVPPIVSSRPPQLVPPIEDTPSPQATPVVSSPPIVSSPPPQSIPPIEFTPLPQMTPPFVSPPELTPPIISSPPLELTPPITSSRPESTPPIVFSPPPELTPPIISSPPESTPPIIYSPPPELAPPITSPPPESTPPIVSSPPNLTPPIVSSPPPDLTPPIVSSPPPDLTPPIVSSPPDSTPPIVSSPPHESTPPIISSPLPESTPPIISSPPPESNPPIVSPPPPDLTPPIVSSPPPESTPPIVSSPPIKSTPPIVSPPPTKSTPPIVSPPPLELTPPIISSPPKSTPPNISSPPQLIPPIESAPLQPTPPIVSPPPQWIIPPTPPTPPLPSNASIPPPLFLPPPNFPSSPPNASPYASPPIPSHAISPLPQRTPPLASSPPYVLPAPPPIELPHIFTPNSPIVPRAVPPHSSLPSPFSNPPLPTPPSSSPRKETQEGASPPSLTSPKSSPSPKTFTNAPPPSHQAITRSHPPSSQIEAPKHSPPSQSNATEPATLPSPAPTPSKNPIGGRYRSIAPPGRAPESEPSPYPDAPEPTIERRDPIAPTPRSLSISPTSNGSHHSLHHFPAKGPTTPMAPSSLPEAPPGHAGIPVPSPKISPSGSAIRNTNKPLAPPILSLPPPPPNTDCAYLTCNEPLTNTPPGSPCGCVWPMQVGMRLGVALYTFFPLVSELAREVATGVSLNTNQVRVMGANATTDEVEKTIVIVNLVPLDKKFDDTFALSIFERFWHKQVIIDKSLFGDYDILYVRYPGLPPSPPMAPADIAIINGMPYSVGDPNKVHPLGVDVTSQRRKHRVNGVVIAAIVFSAVVALLVCCFVAWLLVFRHTNGEPQPDAVPRAIPSLGRSSGPTGNSIGSGPSSSLSIGSSLPPYTGSAKTLSPSEIEKATDNFSPSRILGEGGFGLVYSGVLEDETQVAVKVLKRDDQQGGREFLAEVEMLSRLHHRNLVKLIGICTDERLRCLVYELIPNGSVESHLHGKDKETAPLDWASRMKIALGAARGLAYLHEDSSPRVIHRDFKSSNILLENDFTPKVSDFGLARAAMDEQNRHISTRVMGTFGYVAPEYAMTGHLLVKSDVYSYGVVLLEILTGRKPVDMLQPPGQENLVAWAKPFLNTKEGLELILDPSLGPDIPLDMVAKVAAIASMCVQPEVSHRPFMGEVVQALKLVCNESDDSKGSSSRHGSHGNLSIDFDAKESPVPEARDPSPGQFLDKNYLSGLDVEKGMSVSEIFGAPVSNDRRISDSFRRHFASGPLKTGTRGHFWERVKRLSNGGSVSEHGVMYRLWS